MRKLKLNKSKIATITNPFFIIGGTNNSNAATFCEETGVVSATCFPNCTNHNTLLKIECEATRPSTSRANSGMQLSAVCPDLDGNPQE